MSWPFNESANPQIWCKKETNLKIVSRRKGWAPNSAMMMYCSIVCLHLMIHWRRRIWTLSAEAQSDSSREGTQIFYPYKTVGRIRVFNRSILDVISWKWWRKHCLLRRARDSYPMLIWDWKACLKLKCGPENCTPKVSIGLGDLDLLSFEKEMIMREPSFTHWIWWPWI